MICPIPHPYSPTDPINYEEKFNEVYNELNTNSTFKTILNIEVVPEFTLSIVSSRTSSTQMPTITWITSQWRWINFKVQSDNMVNCYFKPVQGNTRPSSFEVTNCSTSECSQWRYQKDSTVNINVDKEGQYSIYAVCAWAVPGSKPTWEPVLLWSVNVSLWNTSGNNNSTNTNNWTNTSSSSKLFFNLLAFLFSFLLLF